MSTDERHCKSAFRRKAEHADEALAAEWHATPLQRSAKEKTETMRYKMEPLRSQHIV